MIALSYVCSIMDLFVFLFSFTSSSSQIWVKKLVPERYHQPVTVKKIRQVAVPTSVLRQVDDWEVVTVTENKPIEVAGYRIDEVQDSKLVEVEELQNYTLQPVSTGEASLIAARDVGPINGFHHSRRIGSEVFHAHDERHALIEEDHQPMSGTLGRPLASTTGTKRSLNHSGVFNRTGPSASMRSASQSFSSTTTEPDRAIGFKVRDTPENGVQVYRVVPSEAAERAGLRRNDIILYVNNRPTRNLTEFRQVLNASGGPVLMQVRRRGVQKLSLIVHR